MSTDSKATRHAREPDDTNEFGIKNIDDAALTAADIPSPNADLDTVWRFALTFDGYGIWGSFEKCAQIANARLNGSLIELRTCLFFEQRRWRHLEKDPDRKTTVYIRRLIEQIRARVPVQRASLLALILQA